MKILIAEDDRLSRIFLKKFLGNHGDCDVAVDGMEALDLFMDAIKDKEPYDLLCLDIMMPRIDGLKLLKAIRVLEKQHQLKHTYIIMMTALADVEYVDQALELGCDAYAAKPIDTDKVTLVMKNLGLIKE
ncbi:response regulator [Selenomonas sp.]|uniref:response regulator n=1 Tax=Selenomonas sp. TaxID=2053611 RepID=UPI0025CF7A48|nr:response regulator [Selenomonas sp.]MBQ1868413.1 response regulator [Selenomonas sp.]